MTRPLPPNDTTSQRRASTRNVAPAPGQRRTSTDEETGDGPFARQCVVPMPPCHDGPSSPKGTPGDVAAWRPEPLEGRWGRRQARRDDTTCCSIVSCPPSQPVFENVGTNR